MFGGAREYITTGGRQCREFRGEGGGVKVQKENVGMVGQGVLSV